MLADQQGIKPRWLGRFDVVEDLLVALRLRCPLTRRRIGTVVSESEQAEFHAGEFYPNGKILSTPAGCGHEQAQSSRWASQPARSGGECFDGTQQPVVDPVQLGVERQVRDLRRRRRQRSEERPAEQEGDRSHAVALRLEAL